MHSLLQYYHDIFIIFTYFTSFTGYEDDILSVISYLHVEGFKIGRKMDQFGGEKKKLNSAEFMELFFPPKSAPILLILTLF